MSAKTKSLGDEMWVLTALLTYFDSAKFDPIWKYFALDTKFYQIYFDQNIPILEN